MLSFSERLVNVCTVISLDCLLLCNSSFNVCTVISLDCLLLAASESAIQDVYTCPCSETELCRNHLLDGLPTCNCIDGM